MQTKQLSELVSWATKTIRSKEHFHLYACLVLAQNVVIQTRTWNMLNMTSHSKRFKPFLYPKAAIFPNF